jgi:hypothetical protein
MMEQQPRTMTPRGRSGSTAQQCGTGRRRICDDNNNNNETKQAEIRGKMAPVRRGQGNEEKAGANQQFINSQLSNTTRDYQLFFHTFPAHSSKKWDTADDIGLCPNGKTHKP